SLSNEELFAYGLSAVNMRDLALARDANALLNERCLKEPGNHPLKITQLELESSILFAAGQIQGSLGKIDQAVNLSLAHPPIDPLPDPIKPALELKGEMLLRAGRAEQARETFQEALKQTPHRPWSVLGLARSHATAGQLEEASIYYQELLHSWTDARLLGVSEAKTHLSIYGGSTGDGGDSGARDGYDSNGTSN
ncbi:MAG: tetratricopeptide repeat protein, partial [Gammaproteobacteria bacterium]|nr:tetratricopeptide repeat protein [Gammaproteobacteria bacterium]